MLRQEDASPVRLAETHLFSRRKCGVIGALPVIRWTIIANYSSDSKVRKSAYYSYLKTIWRYSFKFVRCFTLE